MNDVEFLKEADKGYTGTLITGSSTGGLTVTVDATAKTFTITAGAASWAACGLAVGDSVTFTGFADGGNNSTFVATTIVGLVLTCSAAAGLVDVVADGGVTAFVSTKLVYTGAGKLGRLRVETGAITITPKDNTTAIWGTVDSTAELVLCETPLRFNTSLKLTFSATGSAYVLYRGRIT